MAWCVHLDWEGQLGLGFAIESEEGKFFRNPKKQVKIFLTYFTQFYEIPFGHTSSEERETHERVLNSLSQSFETVSTPFTSSSRVNKVDLLKRVKNVKPSAECCRRATKTGEEQRWLKLKHDWEKWMSKKQVAVRVATWRVGKNLTDWVQ